MRTRPLTLLKAKQMRHAIKGKRRNWPKRATLRPQMARSRQNSTLTPRKSTGRTVCSPRSPYLPTCFTPLKTWTSWRRRKAALTPRLWRNAANYGTGWLVTTSRSTPICTTGMSLGTRTRWPHLTPRASSSWLMEVRAQITRVRKLRKGPKRQRANQRKLRNRKQTEIHLY